MESAVKEPPRSAFYKFMRDYVRPWTDRVMTAQSLVGSPPVFEDGVFPWTAWVERNWRDIRAEVEVLLQDRARIPTFHGVSPDQYRISTGVQWRSFFLWGMGYKAPANCARCPKTAKVLDNIPGLTTAFFSILAPGTHIPRHAGVTRRLLNCHLALIVPERPLEGTEGCRMEVDDQTVRWREGSCVVFDDTYQHEVWNDTAETRVVLLMQFKRPLRLPARLLGDFFLSLIRLSPYVRDARRNIENWERAYQRIETE